MKTCFVRYCFYKDYVGYRFWMILKKSEKMDYLI